MQAGYRAVGRNGRPARGASYGKAAVRETPIPSAPVPVPTATLAPLVAAKGLVSWRVPAGSKAAYPKLHTDVAGWRLSWKQWRNLSITANQTPYSVSRWNSNGTARKSNASRWWPRRRASAWSRPANAYGNCNAKSTRRLLAYPAERRFRALCVRENKQGTAPEHGTLGTEPSAAQPLQHEPNNPSPSFWTQAAGTIR